MIQRYRLTINNFCPEPAPDEAEIYVTPTEFPKRPPDCVCFWAVTVFALSSPGITYKPADCITHRLAMQQCHSIELITMLAQANQTGSLRLVIAQRV